MIKFRTALATAALLAASMTPALASGNLYDTLKADPQFSTLVQVIDANGLKFRYTDKSPRTVFAPTNGAFDKIKGGYADMTHPNTPSDRQNVQALLLYQIVPGRHTPESLKGKTVTVTTLQQDPVTIDGTGANLHFGSEFGADQAGSAIEASNGIVIPVDTLPTPVFSQSEETETAPAAGTLTPPAGMQHQ